MAWRNSAEGVQRDRAAAVVAPNAGLLAWSHYQRLHAQEANAEANFAHARAVLAALVRANLAAGNVYDEVMEGAILRASMCRQELSWARLDAAAALKTFMEMYGGWEE
jgi:hypothetical protein